MNLSLASNHEVLAQAHPNDGKNAHSVVAKVNKEVIYLAEYSQTLARAARQKFFHGKIPEDKIAQLKRDVIEELILERLLLQEAKKRGIKGSPEAVEKRIEQIDKKNAANERWQKNRERLLVMFRQRLLKNTILGILENKIREVATPDDALLKSYYDKNIEKFTEPQKERVSVILLGVDPGTSIEVWNKAKEEAERIAKNLADGGSFEELAKMHSSDGSASSGGELGYLHRGMLSSPAQDAIDKMKPGEYSAPVKLLQGYGLFQLMDRQVPVVKTFDEIRKKVVDFYSRDAATQQWEELKSNLRGNADVFIERSIVPEKVAEKKADPKTPATPKK